MKITDLYQQVASYNDLPTEYIEKMMHSVPETEVVDRAEYLADAAMDKVIFDVGASGPMSSILREKAAKYYSADKKPGQGKNYYYQMNFDKAGKFPPMPDLELIIAGEVLEHLSNAGHFLDLIHDLGVPSILTVPNAFSAAGHYYLTKNIECVNREHVAWYSYHTLKTLIERHRFRLSEWYWYNGKPQTAEGLIFFIKPLFAMCGGIE